MATFTIRRMRVDEGDDRVRTGGVFEGSATVKYQVETDAAVSLQAILSCQGLPARNSTHPEIPSLVLTGRKATRHENSLLIWDVVDSYGQDSEQQQSGGAGGGGTVEKPWEAPPKIALSQASYREVPVEKHWKLVEGTYQLVPAVNAAGLPFDPPPTRPEKVLVITINEARRNFDRRFIIDYWDSVNLAETVIDGLTFPALSLRLEDLSCSEEFFTDARGTRIPYYNVTFVIHHRKTTWVEEVANMGYRHLDDDRIVDIVVNGKPPGEPMWLTNDGQGWVLPDDPSKFNYIDILPFEPKDWKPLGLPQQRVDRFSPMKGLLR